MNDDFLSWLRSVFGTRKLKTEPYRCVSVSSAPSSPDAKTVYVVGDDECQWAAALLCPCGCRDVINLSLVEDRSPSWRITRSQDGRVTLMPSVWRTVGCRSHFVLYRGNVFWCRDD